jgi:hypothetical protein
MLSKYHIELTNKSLGSFFTSMSLDEIARANVQQDSFLSLFGVEARRHVCDCMVNDSLAYIDEEHAKIAELATQPGEAARQRAALGRLLHTVQDFYAHTNYVALWLAERGATTLPREAGELDPRLLAHPELQVAQWLTWREPFYYVPVVGQAMRRVWLPKNSHEAINLDSPRSGGHFHVAMAIAHQRTRGEYARAVAAIRELGGRAAVARFHGEAEFVPSAHPAGAWR